MAGQARRGGEVDVRQATHSLFWTGLLLGIGLVGSLDEIVLHQLLQWHNFYVHTTQQGRIISDGLFHAFSTAMLLWGAVRLWTDRRLLAEAGRRAVLVAGVLLGAGGFNLYDGIVQHKLFQLHPVREGVADILPYDLAFNGVALVLLVAGFLIWHSAGRAGGRRVPQVVETGGERHDGSGDRAA